MQTKSIKKFLQTMVNRILIRSKVLQIVYSFYQNGNGDLNIAEKELLFSLQKSYDLYHFLLLLIVDITHLQQRVIESRKNKLLPTEEDLHPNMKLANNRFAAQLEGNESLKKYVEERGISWSQDEDFIKSVLNTILKSDIYTEYISATTDDYETDKEFWRSVFKKIIYDNEPIDEHLEECSIYWNNDIEIEETFVIKTIKSFEEKNGEKQPLLPMFRDQDDKVFAIQLLRQTLLKSELFRKKIKEHLKNWEAERIANIDLLIMQIALAEIMTFPTIPTTVSLNEYINIAKIYSTPKSASFINGILDSIVNELKKEKILLKE